MIYRLSASSEVVINLFSNGIGVCKQSGCVCVPCVCWVLQLKYKMMLKHNATTEWHRAVRAPQLRLCKKDCFFCRFVFFWVFFRKEVCVFSGRIYDLEQHFELEIQSSDTPLYFGSSNITFSDLKVQHFSFTHSLVTARHHFGVEDVVMS